jgi:hypothetical protein
MSKKLGGPNNPLMELTSGLKIGSLKQEEYILEWVLLRFGGKVIPHLCFHALDLGLSD